MKLFAYASICSVSGANSMGINLVVEAQLTRKVPRSEETRR